MKAEPLVSAVKGRSLGPSSLSALAAVRVEAFDAEVFERFLEQVVAEVSFKVFGRVVGLDVEPVGADCDDLDLLFWFDRQALADRVVAAAIDLDHAAGKHRSQCDAALADELSRGVHALAIKAYAPGEPVTE